MLQKRFIFNSKLVCWQQTNKLIFQPAKASIPSKLKTAITPEVLCNFVECIPDTNNNVSESLNCENCAYCHEYILMSV